MFARGDTFYGPVNFLNRTPHLWIVLHCDSEHLLWVNVTTFRDGRDKSCVLLKGDHPFITLESIINYREAQNPLIANIQEALTLGYLERCEPCTPALIKKILAGAQATCFLKDKFKQLCT